MIAKLFRTDDIKTRPLRARLSAALIFGAVLAACLVMGYPFATVRTLQRESTLAKRIGVLLGNVIAAAQSDGGRLAQFAGQSCESIQSGLAGNNEPTRYVRSALFVRGDRIYCSTLAGKLDLPLPAQLHTPAGTARIVMYAGSPRFSHRQTMMVYERLSATSGMGLVVPGDYVVDILESAQIAGARSVIVSGTDGSVLASDGSSAPPPPEPPRQAWAHYVAPQGLFSVSVEAGPEWRLQDQFEVEGLALVAGLLLGTVCAGAYLACYRPGQRLIRHVRRALQRGEFVVHYQPIVDMATGQWVGAEALVRWQHPRRGLVTPAHFIAEVERSPLIADLTQFVLRRALSELGGMDLPGGFRLTVNLAAFHAGLRCFPCDLSNILAASGTRLQVVLEITERGLLAGIDDVKDSLAQLRREGVRFAVDDFGTENSNLALLQRFHFDYIKIDRQFVQGVGGGDRALVEAIRFLAGQVGALVIAEGVEEAEQQAILVQIGVPLAQGFLFARPGEAGEFERGYAASRERAAD